MKCLARALAAWVVLAWAVAGPAAARTVGLAPSAALACLTPAAAQRGEPEFSFEAWKEGQKVSVTVVLEFTEPDSAPEVTLLKQEGGEAFVAAVKAHVQRWRVPCLKAGAVASLQQAFHFDPDANLVHADATKHLADPVRRQALDCMMHLSGRKSPPYPPAALQGNVQGFVLAKLGFSAPDQPPQVEVHARPGATLLKEAILDWATGLRLPCLSGERIDTVSTYKFHFEGDRYGLRPLTLPGLLPSVTGIKTATLQLDTEAMGCPFVVSWQYRRPAMDNLVVETEKSLPERAALLAWLRQIDLNLPSAALDAAFGDKTLITVPCLKINLNPKEKT